MDNLSAQCLARAKELDVAVVGGGLAGLAAARDLARWGARVHVYEARAQVGGRVLSDTGFASGRVVEYGAELIGSIHTRWCALAREYGLSLIGRLSGDVYGGQQLRSRWILDRPLTPDEINAIEVQQHKVLRAIAEFARDRIPAGMESHPWDHQPLAALDGVSVATALQQRFGVTPGSRLWLAMRFLLENNNVAPLDQMSFLALLCLVRGGQTEKATVNDPLMGYWYELEIYRSAEGCQRLAVALAKDVDAHRGCRVTTQLGVRRINLRPRGGGVLVTVRSTKDSSFDRWLREKIPDNPLMLQRKHTHVILTAPPTVWDAIEIIPEHPRSIGLMGEGPAAKFFSRLDKRFWVSEGTTPLSGSLDIGQVWEGSDNQMLVRGQDVALNVFSGNRIPTESQYRSGLAKIYPAAPGRPGTGYAANLRGTPKLVDWSRQPFIRTGYASPRVGQVTTVGRRLSQPFGELMFFAGEHSQPDHFGYMEGAIRSGERAARTLLGRACAPQQARIA